MPDQGKKAFAWPGDGQGALGLAEKESKKGPWGPHGVPMGLAKKSALYCPGGTKRRMQLTVLSGQKT